MRTPVAKLSLPVRKNLRDKWEAKIPELQQKLAKLGFPEYSFVVDPLLIYAYAETDYTKESTGACIYEYFSGFVSHVDRFTNSGKDTGAVEMLKKVASKNAANLLPDETNRFSYNGCEIKDGQIFVYFNAKSLGSNITDAAREIAKAVDQAIDALGGDDLPITVQRGVQKMEKKLAELQPQVEKILGKPYSFEHDISKNYAKMKAEIASLGNADYLERSPDLIFHYFKAAVSALEYKKFGQDSMLQEAFNEAAEKGVIRFEIVDKLQNGTYNDCVFEDGELKLQAPLAKFGSNIDNVCEKIMDRL